MNGIDYSFLALKFSSGKIIVTKYVNAKLLLNGLKGSLCRVCFIAIQYKWCNVAIAASLLQVIQSSYTRAHTHTHTYM